MVLAAAHFVFWEVQDISTTPRIISSLGKSHKIVFNLALITCHIAFFSSIFPSFPSKELFFGKRSVLIGFSFFSSFWASWMVLAAAHFDF